MRYFHLELLACPVCRNTRLLTYVLRERDASMPESPERVKCRRWCGLYDRPAESVPLKSCTSTCMYREIEDGILVCTSCGRWYPVVNGIAVMLDDKYRDERRDREFLRQAYERLPEWVRKYMQHPNPEGLLQEDEDKSQS